MRLPKYTCKERVKARSVKELLHGLVGHSHYILKHIMYTSTAAPQKKKQRQQQKQRQKKKPSNKSNTTIPIRRQDSITSTTSPTSDEHLLEL